MPLGDPGLAPGWEELDRREAVLFKVVLAHYGGSLPALSSRLGLLGAESWAPNPLGITAEEIRADLARLYLDTAATGTDANLASAVTMVPRDHLVYGGDAEVPCSNEDSMGRRHPESPGLGRSRAPRGRGSGSARLRPFPGSFPTSPRDCRHSRLNVQGVGPPWFSSRIRQHAPSDYAAPPTRQRQCRVPARDSGQYAPGPIRRAPGRGPPLGPAPPCHRPPPPAWRPSSSPVTTRNGR
ncbi:hypothetical protein BJY54_000340 [Streptomyces nodosus]|nr:hypothetical protein [Streptomyces nodosus]